ncbi:MAG: DNA-directed RNA polymerase subunit sigma-24 [Peptococcaceae bacterium BRH_c4b]|nr:MAG: DNA-directed RNA polymerase subunit sigma-24 [Peptococcaceae bacterium BRH_c4b]
MYEADPEDARIMAWFLTGLRREAHRLAKKHRRLKKRELLILDGPVKWNVENDGIAMVDTVAAVVDTFTEAEESIYIHDMLSTLTSQQQKVIMATIIKGATEREVALELGMSQPAVHQMKERALNRLRKKLYPG